MHEVSIAPQTRRPMSKGTTLGPEETESRPFCIFLKFRASPPCRAIAAGDRSYLEASAPLVYRGRAVFWVPADGVSCRP
jgi:hypothetical protein